LSVPDTSFHQQALAPMNLTLEILLQETCLKIGKQITEGDKEKTLYLLIKETKNQITKEIDNFLYQIRTTANTALHYNALKNYITFTKEEVEVLYSLLLKVVEFYIAKFKL
jgi:hypothetical protein